MQEVFNARETRELLHISNMTYLRRLDSGELKGYREGREWRHTTQDIADYQQLQRDKLAKRRTKESALDVALGETEEGDNIIKLAIRVPETFTAEDVAGLAETLRAAAALYTQTIKDQEETRR